MAVKTICPISHKQFREHAKPIDVVINGTPLHAAVKEFSTGSLGWYLNGKMNITIDGKPVSVQIGLNMTIVGSKDVSKEPAPAHAAQHAPMPAGEPQG
jgi:hypothetical protein